MAQKISKKTITKKDLILRVADHCGQRQSVARDIIQRFIDEIVAELSSGNRLELRDFGVFEVRRREPRKARNPKTGAQVQVPPKHIVTIKPGKLMKERINAAMEATERQASQNTQATPTS